MSSNSERFVSEPITIKGRFISHVWDDLLAYIIEHGVPTAPRVLSTKEKLNVTLHIEEPRNNILVNNIRALGYKAMIAEWLWIASGTDKLAPLLQYNKNYAKYTDDGTTLYGAYGPRIRKSWDEVIRLLRRDRDTRQAVISIWAPDTRRDTKDTPCTLSLHFLIRNDRLNLTVNMRSSDAWLGLPNDFYVFSQLQNEMACEVDEDMGSLTMNLGSSHLYMENFEKAEQAVELRSICLRSPAFHMTWPLKELYKRFEEKSPTPITLGPRETIWNKYVDILNSPSREETFWILRKMEHLDDD
jgi:thymidylate synthase